MGSDFKSVRKPAVAGQFYPKDPNVLSQQIDGFLKTARPVSIATCPKAIVAPHAGTVYSGPIAAMIYKLLTPYRLNIRRVVLVGPSHHVPLRGLALSGQKSFATPLGEISVDQSLIAKIQELPGVQVSEEAHSREHSLEIHLPFLQRVLEDFTVLPLVVGDCSPALVAQVLRAVWGGPETLIVISSDLSHYLEYDDAIELDTKTSTAICEFRWQDLSWDDCCGRVPIQGLLLLGSELGLKARMIDYRNSGDTSGSKEQVVGYGAYAFFE